LILQFLENRAGEELVDLTVTRNRLRHTCTRILIPIVPTAVPDQAAAGLFQPSDEGRCASSESQFGNFADSRNFSAGQIKQKVAEVFL
jgi:hypothetical protein